MMTASYAVKNNGRKVLGLWITRNGTNSTYSSYNDIKCHTVLVLLYVPFWIHSMTNAGHNVLKQRKTSPDPSTRGRVCGSLHESGIQTGEW